MRALAQLCVTVPAALLIGTTVSGQALTEQQALARFMAENPEIEALRRRVDERGAHSLTRVLASNPTVGWTQENAGGNRDDFLVFKQELPLSGRLGLLATANRESAASDQSDADFQIQQLRADVRLAFAALLHAQQREQALDDAGLQLQEVVRILGERERQGEGSRFDRLRGDRELAELTAEQAAESVEQIRAQANLAALLGISGPASDLAAVDVADEARPWPALEATVQRALGSRTDLQAGTFRLASYDAEQEAARRRRFPQPAVSAGMKRSRFSGVASTGYTIGVDLTVPLFNRGHTEAARATASIGRLRAEQDALRLSIEREVRATYRVALLRQQQARAYVEAAGVSGQALAQIARLAYEEGEQGILELLDAYRIALATRLRGFDLAAAARRSAVELSRAVGEDVLR